jgi:hypothetical protein
MRAYSYVRTARTTPTPEYLRRRKDGSGTDGRCSGLASAQWPAMTVPSSVPVGSPRERQSANKMVAHRSEFAAGGACSSRAGSWGLRTG